MGRDARVRATRQPLAARRNFSEGYIEEAHDAVESTPQRPADVSTMHYGNASDTSMFRKTRATDAIASPVG